MFVFSFLLAAAVLFAGLWLIRWGGMRIDAARANLDGTAGPIKDIVCGLGVAGAGLALCIAAWGAVGF